MYVMRHLLQSEQWLLLIMQHGYTHEIGLEVHFIFERSRKVNCHFAKDTSILSLVEVGFCLWSLPQMVPHRNQFGGITTWPFLDVVYPAHLWSALGRMHLSGIQSITAVAKPPWWTTWPDQAAFQRAPRLIRRATKVIWPQWPACYFRTSTQHVIKVCTLPGNVIFTIHQQSH